MSYVCVLATSLFTGKECDDWGRCEDRYDEWDAPYDEDEEYEMHCMTRDEE